MEETEHRGEIPKLYPANATIDNFFIGGEWDKYLQQVVLPKTESVHPNPKIEQVVVEKHPELEIPLDPGDSCSGKYIYVHDLPTHFNSDILKHCRSLSKWMDMCPFISNMGLGPQLQSSDKVVSNEGWYETNQFVVRMMRDHYSMALIQWIREKPEWKRMWGRDHFMVAGRISWDFRRLTEKDDHWGNKLMVLPESKNMTMMRKIRRRTLFSFAGAPRPNLKNSIRSEIIQQCKSARRKCQLLGCHPSSKKCDDPSNLLKMFQSSIFCLQPPGDSYTRRSTFDSILAGCIPVFFHPGSAYVQYLWHFPKDFTKYSVFIPGDEVKEGKANITRILSRISRRRVVAMREQVVRLIPGIVYADPRSSLETLEDAFDITVDGVLERIDGIRKEMIQGKNLTVSEAEEESNWKKTMFGTIGPHPWDHFFIREREWNPQ
ncbi:unnamed protein product [Linum tenue]|uniref:Exostosin GT47 domain-containing protein n=1 Tax=Linum tenue TaxID=586396 RepID=A0AAV0Q693_9ROSI|nr:unnamed protein product [Linum tenue]